MFSKTNYISDCSAGPAHWFWSRGRARHSNHAVMAVARPGSDHQIWAHILGGWLWQQQGTRQNTAKITESVCVWCVICSMYTECQFSGNHSWMTYNVKYTNKHTVWSAVSYNKMQSFEHMNRISATFLRLLFFLWTDKYNNKNKIYIYFHEKMLKNAFTILIMWQHVSSVVLL